MAVAFVVVFKAVRLVKTLVTLPPSVSANRGSWPAVSVWRKLMQFIYFNIVFITLVTSLKTTFRHIPVLSDTFKMQ